MKIYKIKLELTQNLVKYFHEVEHRVEFSLELAKLAELRRLQGYIVVVWCVVSSYRLEFGIPTKRRKWCFHTRFGKRVYTHAEK